MKHILSILIISTIFANVTNNAILTIDADVNLMINGNFTNNSTIENNGSIQVYGLFDGDNGTITGNGVTQFLGDANSDMNFNILDLVIMIDIILDNYYGGQDVPESVLWICDLNNDAIIDILDIMIMIDQIMTINF